MGQGIRPPDRCTLTARGQPAIFVGWHNLEAWNICIDLWPSLWVAFPREPAAKANPRNVPSTKWPTWWTERYEGLPLLRVSTPWNFAYFTSWIQALLKNERVMNSVWCITVREFAVFTLAAFLEAAEHGIERHETNDPGFNVELIVMYGVSLSIPGRTRACFGPNQLIQLLH